MCLQNMQYVNIYFYSVILNCLWCWINYALLQIDTTFYNHTNVTWDINVQGSFEHSHSYQREHIHGLIL